MALLLALAAMSFHAARADAPRDEERAAPVNPDDTAAHFELMTAHRAAGRSAPALYHAAWLFLLGREGDEDREAARYLRQSAGRVRSLSRQGSPSEQLWAGSTLAVLEAREKLVGSALRGTLSSQRESVRRLLSRVAEEAARLPAGSDAVVLAARAHCLLVAACGTEAISWPAIAGSGKPYLRRALVLARQLTDQLPDNGRAWELLATARERLARVNGDWWLTGQAEAACQRAFLLHQSPSLRFALDDLRARLDPKFPSRDPEAATDSPSGTLEQNRQSSSVRPPRTPVQVRGE